MNSGQNAFRGSHTVSLPVCPEFFFTGARPWRGERDQALKQQLVLLPLHSQCKRTPGNTCTSIDVYHATLLVILTAKNWKQSKGPFIWSSLNKLWFIQSMEYLFYVLKTFKNIVDFHVRTWNGVHNVLSENRELRRLQYVQ